MGPCIYLEETVLGQDVGFDLKVCGLRNWKDGSGIAQDGEEGKQDKFEREASGHVNFEMSISPSKWRR